MTDKQTAAARSGGAVLVLRALVAVSESATIAHALDEAATLIQDLSAEIRQLKADLEQVRAHG